MKKQESRHGKHHEDKVQFGGMVTPEFKALATLTASRLRIKMTDLMANGINSEATRAGIMLNGQIKDEFKEAIANIAGILREKRDAKRRKDHE